MPAALGQANKGATASATSQATGTMATQAAGSTMVGGGVYQGTFSAYTDNKSNSPYVQIDAERTVDTTNAAKMRLYYFANAVGGAGHTTTLATTTAQPITNVAAEFTGLLAVGPLDVANGGNDTSSPYGNAVSITPTAGRRVLVALFGGNSGSNPATQAESQGFTVISAAQELNGATFWTACLAYKIVTADGVTAYTAQFTESGATEGAVILAAFKEASTSMGSLRGVGPGYGPINKRTFARGTRSFTGASLVATSGTDGLTFGQTGALGGLGALAGTATLTFGQTGALTANGALAGSTTLTFTATGTADPPSGAMVGTATLVFGQSGALGGLGALSGTIALQFGQSCAAGANGALSGAAAFTFAHTADLKGATALVGTAALTFDQSGNLAALAGAIAGIATITFALSGSLDQPAGAGDVGEQVIIHRRRRRS